MLTGHCLKTCLLLTASSLLVGCAQTGRILPGRVSYGTLKTSLSHLEFENQELRTQVAQLQSENREIENRLVQEEEVNGNLTARLDDARNLLSDRGYDLGGSDRSLSRQDPPADESPSRTLPAGRSNRKPRKPPFARIPGRIESAPPADDTSNRSTIPGNDPFGPQGRQDDPTRWLPIARETNEPPSRVR
jgi:hypothetical protein